MTLAQLHEELKSSRKDLSLEDKIKHYYRLYTERVRNLADPVRTDATKAAWRAMGADPNKDMLETIGDLLKQRDHAFSLKDSCKARILDMLAKVKAKTEED